MRQAHSGIATALGQAQFDHPPIRFTARAAQKPLPFFFQPIVPQKMTSWKLALYLIVFLLPGGSFAILGMGWYENRRQRMAAAKVSSASKPALLPAHCACPGNGGA
ncbi:hypothetical protein BPMI_04035 [Candidatus Burkholderia pumila]|uniref:Uncharacterized protein n=1 Tax=Candidatus Burkholderia pumila TaxID=1090375 RepID=A0ABR5HNI1_9BURK|nr:hypothetical protein BPMI_04035 [Candidatus Burkholderia pumila]